MMNSLDFRILHRLIVSGRGWSIEYGDDSGLDEGLDDLGGEVIATKGRH
jgi:hypothetical protein